MQQAHLFLIFPQVSCCRRAKLKKKSHVLRRRAMFKFRVLEFVSPTAAFWLAGQAERAQLSPRRPKSTRWKLRSARVQLLLSLQDSVAQAFFVNLVCI